MVIINPNTHKGKNKTQHGKHESAQQVKNNIVTRKAPATEHSQMNPLYGFFAIAIALALGHALHILWSGLPASLYGMITLTLLLQFGVFSAAKVSAAITWLLRHIGVCFVPAGVGIIEHLALIQQYGLVLVGVIFFTTFLLLTLVGLSFQKLENIENSPLKRTQ